MRCLRYVFLFIIFRKNKCGKIRDYFTKINRKSVLIRWWKVYDPFSNSCIERTNNISIDDIDSILHGTRDDVFLNIKTKTEHPYRSYVRCHHGKTDETNRTCICNDGWDSFMNFSVPIVSTVPVHMCTVKIPNKSYYGFPSSLTMLDPKDIVSFTAQYQWIPIKTKKKMYNDKYLLWINNNITIKVCEHRDTDDKSDVQNISKKNKNIFVY